MRNKRLSSIIGLLLMGSMSARCRRGAAEPAARQGGAGCRHRGDLLRSKNLATEAPAAVEEVATEEPAAVEPEATLTAEEQAVIASAAAAEAVEAAKASGKTAIRWFVGLGTGTDPQQIEAQQAVVDAFNASQDKIQLVLEIVPFDAAEDTLATQIASGAGPDIVGPVGWGGSNAFYGQWLDLSPSDRRNRIRHHRSSTRRWSTPIRPRKARLACPSPSSLPPPTTSRHVRRGWSGVPAPELRRQLHAGWRGS